MGAASRWLLEVLAAVALWGDGPWIASEDWNVEVAELEAFGWSATVEGRVMAPSETTCTGGKRSVIDYFLVSQSMVALVQGVTRVGPPATTLHWPVRLSLFASHWWQVVVAPRQPRSFPVEFSDGPGAGLLTPFYCGGQGCR